MLPTAVVISRMLEDLEEEDFQTAITFIQFLSDTRKKKKAADSKSMDDMIMILKILMKRKILCISSLV